MTNIIRTVESGPVMHIQTVDGKVDEVIHSLYNVRHMTAYKKEDIPERWHFKNNRRVMPIFLVAEKGWLITAVSIIINKTCNAQNTLGSKRAFTIKTNPEYASDTANYQRSNSYLYDI